jgi:phosphatidylglycerophosphate synthase
MVETRWILLCRLEETSSLHKYRVPWVITALRVVALPLLIYSFNQEIKAATYALFLFAVSTDFLDGCLAKQFETISMLGSYFDVTADFVFVSGMFLVFVLEGFYQSWILLLIVFVFAQFMLTNVYSKHAVYDPVGKYYGSLMYGGVGLTLLFQEQLMLDIVTVGIVVSTVAALFSRVAFLLVRKRKQPQ